MRALFSMLGPRARVVDLGGLRSFLTSEAIYLSQKATIDYCRARAGLGWENLAREPVFMAELEKTRWQAMAAVLADMLIVTEGVLRPAAGVDSWRLGAGLGTLFGEILDAAPAPDGARMAWEETRREWPARMGRAQLAQPRNPGEVARVSAQRVFDLIPIHASLRRDDREMVVNSVRFGMVAFSEKLERSLTRPEALVAELIALAPDAVGGGPSA
jgi:hypothetical protein